MDSITLINGIRCTGYSLLSRLYRGRIDKKLNLLIAIFHKMRSFYDDQPPFEKDEENLSNAIIGKLSIPHYIEQVRTDYNALFVGPGEILAPPWESVYTTKEKLLFSKQEVFVRRIYCDAGLAVAQSDPADHLALELAFMARLCLNGGRKKQLTDNILQQQKKFLDEHLSKWIVLWADQVERSAQTDFWRILARVTQAWVANDILLLQNNMKERKVEKKYLTPKIGK